MLPIIRLLYYREALFGLTLEDLIAQKKRNVEAENHELRMTGKSLKVATAPQAAAPKGGPAAAATSD
jgi:hypothetical protein